MQILHTHNKISTRYTRYLDLSCQLLVYNNCLNFITTNPHAKMYNELYSRAIQRFSDRTIRQRDDFSLSTKNTHTHTNNHFISTVPLIKWLAGRSRTRMYQMNQFSIWNKLHFRVTAKLLWFFSFAFFFFVEATFYLLHINNETSLGWGNSIRSKEHRHYNIICCNISCRIDFDVVILRKLR